MPTTAGAATRMHIARPVALLTALALLATGGILGLAVPAHAAIVSETVDGITYFYNDEAEEGDRTATVTAGPAAGVVEIPETVPLSIGGGGTADYTVTEIGVGAFSGSGLTGVTIPARVTGIGQQAFQNTASLTEVTIEGGTVPLTIGLVAFAGSGLTSITIPGRTASIGNQAFFDTASLTEVTIEDSPEPLIISASVFSNSGLTSVTIPERVDIIANAAFAGSTPLESVFLLGPAPTVTATGADFTGSFGQAAGKTLFVPWSELVEQGGDYTTPAWQGYDTVARAVVSYDLAGGPGTLDPEWVPIDGEDFTPAVPPGTAGWAFAGWYTDAALTELYVPGPLMGDLTLYASWAPPYTDPATGIVYDYDPTDPAGDATVIGYVGGSTDVTIPDTVTLPVDGGGTAGYTVTVIGDNAFRDSDLTDVAIPETVTTIGDSAFRDTASLTAVTIADGPDPLTINDNAFLGSGLTGVTIPARVTSIGASAFGGTTPLESVFLLGPAPGITAVGATGSFGHAADKTLYVPWSQLVAQGGVYTTPSWQGYDTVARAVVAYDLGEGPGVFDPEWVPIDGEDFTPAVPPDTDDEAFAGWYTDPDLTAPYVPGPLTGDLTLYAGWAEPSAGGSDPLPATGSDPLPAFLLGGGLLLLGGVVLAAHGRIRIREQG